MTLTRHLVCAFWTSPTSGLPRHFVEEPPKEGSKVPRPSKIVSSDRAAHSDWPITRTGGIPRVRLVALHPTLC